MTDNLKMTILDQDNILISSLKRLSELGGLGRFEVAQIHSDPNICIEKANNESIVVFDLNTKHIKWEDFVVGYKAKNPKARIAILTKHEESSLVKKALTIGVDAYISKSETLSGFLEGLDKAMDGETYYSENLSPSPKFNSSKSHDSKSTLDAFEDSFEVVKLLTPREKVILNAFVSAKSGKEISVDLNISEQTVAVHKKNIMRKLKVNSTVSLMKLAIEKNLL